MSHRLRKLLTGVLNILAWLVFPFAVGVSLVGFLSQAVRTSRRRSFKKNIDVLIIGVAYSVVAGTLSSSLQSAPFSKRRKQTNNTGPDDACILRGRISVVRKLHRLSRERVALRKGDVPKVRVRECSGFHHRRRLTIAQHVHEYLTQEYSRTCLISFESLPKYAHREGWGRPGTPLLPPPFQSYSGVEVGSFCSTGHTCFVPQALDGMGSAFDGFCSILYQILVRPSHL